MRLPITEHISENDPEHPPVSPRRFGLTVCAALVVVGCIRVGHSLWSEELPFAGAVPIILWAVGGVLLMLALVRPHWLALPNLLWFRFGLLLSRVVNPIILFILYATCVVPTGFAMRLFGHDPLRLKRDEDTDTYWIMREPSRLEKPMRHQF